MITRKGGTVVTIPLTPRTACAIDLATGDRADGPTSSPPAGAGWTGTAPGGSSARSPAAPGLPSPSGPTRCGTHSSPLTARLDAGVPLRDVQEAASHADPRTTMRYDKARELHQPGEKPQVG